MFKLFKLGSKKAKAVAVFAVLFVVLQGVFEVLQTTMLARILDVVNVKAGESVDMKAFYISCIMLMANAIASFICGGLGSWLGTKSSLMIAETIRHNMFHKATLLSFADVDKVSTASIITRITNDVQKFQVALQLALALFIRAPIMFFCGIILSFIKSWLFGLIFLAIMALMVTSIVVIAKIVVPAFENVQTEIDNSNVVVRENILGIKVIKSFCLEEQQAKRFNKYNDRLRKHNTKAWVGFGMILPIINAVMNIGMGVVYMVAGKMALSGVVEIGTIYTIFNLLMITLTSIIISCVVIINCVRAMPSARRINEFLNLEPSIKNSKNPKKLDPKNLEIKFDHVNFKYFDDAQANVLNNINVTIKQGEMVGIVGPTGSGKTSLINLISRLYDIPSKGKNGKLTIGGIPVKDIDLDSLQSQVGVVLQERILFSGTIKKNLLYGDQKATDKDLWAAAKIACADVIIKEKKGGLNAVVDQRGKNFSGGQQQRLCIARTLVKKPNILILDDSTSALDMLTEAKLQANIRNNMKGMTTIIVAQRISSVKDCDHIIVMDKGRIVDYGTHDSLRKSCELYRSIVVSQMGKAGLR